MSSQPCRDAEERITGILEALSAFESGLLGRAPRACTFGRRKTWLISDRQLGPALAKLAGLGAFPIPGLFGKHILGVVGNRLAAPGFNRRLRSDAAAIQLKDDGTRLRAFFLGSGDREHCLKIVEEDTPLGARTRNEIAVRRRLTDMATIATPRIERVEEDQTYLYVLEEMVHGRRFRRRRDSRLFETEGLDQLAATYKASGARQEPIARYLPDRLAGEVEKAVGRHGDAEDLISRLDGALGGNLKVPVSLCHGDLLPSNIAVSSRRLVFFDWEMAAEGAIPFDLLRMALKYPRWTSLLEAIRTCLDTHFEVSAKDFWAQFTAYMALRVVANPTRAPERLAYWRRHLD